MARQPKAKQTPKQDNTAALSPDEGVVVPRLSLGEQGFVGLKVFNKQIIDEANKAFIYPNFIRTVNEIRYNTTVGAAMNVYRMLLSRVRWDVEPPIGATEEELARVDAVRSMMDDMEHSWASFIESVVPYLEYGFGINEKVLRRRLARNGSKHNDGLVGIRKLPIRNQDTIVGWVFSEDGADLLKVEQTLQNLENAYRFQNRTNDVGRIEIDRDKFLLFSASANKGNPQGNSIYKNVFLAYKRMEILQDQELLGIAKDIQGILKIEAPPQYLDPQSSAENRAVGSGFMSIIDNYNNGTQRGLYVPRIIDPETKLPLFTYELLEAKGIAKYDIESVIRRLQTDILTALNVDVLRLGNDGTGSFSLAESKTSILSLAIDYRLREIQQVLNSDLMRTIYAANGWECTRLPTFSYVDVEEVDIAEFSSAVQRIFATSAIEMDREVMNKIRKVFGVAALPDDMPVQEDKLPANVTGQSSKSGEGMKSGAGDGTRKNAISGSGDSSVANKENAA